MKTRTILLSLLVMSILLGLALVGCSGSGLPDGATPIPTEYLPTAIAQTLQAQGLMSTGAPATPGPAEGEPAPVGASADAAAPANPEEPPEGDPPTEQEPEAAPTVEPPEAPPPATASFQLPRPLPTPTQASLIPAANVQIYRLGDRSRVVSPIQVTTYLATPGGKTVYIELTGEDGRMLVRHVKAFDAPLWNATTLAVDLEFEIAATGEMGRLTVSVEDQLGRLVAVNSVNLVLLSDGETDLNPASTLDESIVIQEPIAKSLIQGSVLIVSGLAKPFDANQPLRVQLITEDGHIVGQRLAGVTSQPDSAYSTFAAEVPYTVSALTPARLIVFEEGGILSQVSHLNSVEVLLSP